MIDEETLAADPEIAEHAGLDELIEPLRGRGAGDSAPLDDVADAAVRLLEQHIEQI